MNVLGSARLYWRTARDQSRFWGRPLPETAAKLLLGRLLFARGPVEFEQQRFALKPVRDWRHYLDEGERQRLQERASPAEFRALEEDKLRFWRRCTDAGLPTVPITALVAPEPGLAAPAGVSVAESADVLAGLLEPLGDFAGFAKPLRGGQGYGTFAFDVRRGAVTMPDGLAGVRALFDRCETQRPVFGGGGYLLQPRLRAHPALSGVMPGAGLGSVRLVSFLSRDGSVEIPWVTLAAPGAEQLASNLHFGSLAVPVDPSTGQLGAAVGRTPDEPVVHSVERHPDTGVRFADVVIPEWQGVKDLVVRAARAFPELPCLGWDVAVTTDGPTLLEANWAFGMCAQEMVQNRGLRLELRHHFALCTRT